MTHYQAQRYMVVEPSYMCIQGPYRSRIEAIAQYCHNRAWIFRDKFPMLKRYGEPSLCDFRNLTGLRNDYWKAAQDMYDTRTVPVALSWEA